jgi:hypothetical protein
MLVRELEWYESEDKILLATIVINHDYEFSVIILGRDNEQKYHCINDNFIPPVKRLEDEDAKRRMFREINKDFKKELKNHYCFRCCNSPTIF